MKIAAILLVALLVAWAALAPPLFTNGACTAEFEAVSKLLADKPGDLRTPKAVAEFFSARSVPYQVISPEQCRKAKPRYLSRCENGPLVVARVPVKDAICRIYRDSEILVRLQYDDRDRLQRMALDMAPYKSLPVPGTGIVVHWAR